MKHHVARLSFVDQTAPAEILLVQVHAGLFVAVGDQKHPTLGPEEGVCIAIPPQDKLSTEIRHLQRDAILHRRAQQRQAEEHHSSGDQHYCQQYGNPILALGNLLEGGGECDLGCRHRRLVEQRSWQFGRLRRALRLPSTRSGYNGGGVRGPRACLARLRINPAEAFTELQPDVIVSIPPAALAHHSPAVKLHFVDVEADVRQQRNRD
jgi:hypothetical protein